MAINYDKDKPITGTSPTASDMRDNFEAIKKSLANRHNWSDTDETQCTHKVFTEENIIPVAALQSDARAGQYSESLIMVNTSSGTYVKLKEHKIKMSGTYTVRFGLMATDTGTAYGRIYKNGVALGTERSTILTTIVYFSENLAFSADDLIQLYMRLAGLGPAYGKDMQWWTPTDFAGAL